MHGASARFEGLSRSISSLEQRLTLLNLNREVRILENHFDRKFSIAQEKDQAAEEKKETESVSSVTSTLAEATTLPDSLLKPFTEDDDDREIAHDLFTKLTIQTNSSVSGSSAEALLLSARKHASDSEYYLISAILTAMQSEGTDGHPGQIGAISIPMTFEKFLQAFQKLPRVRGERMKWARTLGIDAALARLLRKGDAFDGLRGLRELSEAEADAHVQEVSTRLFKVIPELLKRGIRQLGETAAARSSNESNAHAANTKFGDSSLTVGRFASLSDFYKGPEALFGTPNPRVDEGIRKEHLDRPNANIVFTSHNYGIDTCPRKEWEIVVSPQAGQQHLSNPDGTSKRRFVREVIGVDMLLMRPDVKAEVERTGLLRTEVICLRLYTGPMYVMYNAALRGLPKEDADRLLGNKYETSIFVITSGITKLSKFTDLPKSRLLYRGLSGHLVLPYQFWNRHGECRVQLRVRTGNEAAAQAAARLFLSDKVLSYQVPEGGFLEKYWTSPCSYSLGISPESNRAMSDLVTVAAQVVLVEVDVVDVRLGLVVSSPGYGLDSADMSQLIGAVRARCGNSSTGSAHSTEVTVEEITRKTDHLRGGVEFGMLSLTKSLDVAVQYGKEACGRRGVVFEVQVGRVDIGASIGFLSQYPEEEEFLMPPLSCLEVTGEPRLDLTQDGNEVVLIPLRVNMNLKAMSVEDLIGRRKMLHAAATKNLRDELVHIADECVERLGLLFEQRRRGTAEILRGSAENVSFERCATENGGIASFVGRCWTTVWAPYLTLSKGRVYFEVEVLEATGTLVVGFAGTRYSTDAKVDVGDDAASWGIYSFDKSRHNTVANDLPGLTGWFRKGAVLCVAVDLDKGCILAAVGRSCNLCTAGEETQIESYCDWVEIYSSGAKPSSTVGGGLFPVFAGGWGACVYYNFGHQKMKHSPPTVDFIPVTEAIARVSSIESGHNSNPLMEDAASQLRGLDVDNIAMLRCFDEVRERQEALPAEDYNDDNVYKDALDHILFAKMCAVKKQAAVAELLQAGAKPSFLDVMRTAPPGDFNTASAADLVQECPEYSWRLLLSGWLRFVQEVMIPLKSAPCLIALVWRLALDAAAHRDTNASLVKVRLGEIQLNLSNIIPTLQLMKAGLQSVTFENAVLGFFLAAGSGDKFDRNDWSNAAANTAQFALTAADLQGLNFSQGGALRLAQTIVDCRRGGSLRSVNGLVLDRPKDGQELQFCIKRNFQLPKLPQHMPDNAELGAKLDPVDWGFVTAEAACNEWQSLNVRSNRLGPTGATSLSVGLGTVTTLTALDVSGNDMQAKGATALGCALTSLVALTWLEAGRNRIGATGAAALAAGARLVLRLQGLGLANNEIGDAGASFVHDHVAMLANLVRLDLTNNCLAEAGGQALATALLKMPKLIVMGLGGQDVGGAVWLILKVLFDRIESLSIESGVVMAKPAASPAAVILTQPFAVSADTPQEQPTITIDLCGKRALGPEGSQHLAKSLQEGSAGRSLTSLELALNGILPEGATKLAPALATLSALTRLGLSSNGIKHGGSREIASVLPKLKRLRSLSLEGNAIGVLGWLELAEVLSQLQELSSLNGSDSFGALVAGNTADLDLTGRELAAAIAALLPRNGKTLKSLDISANCLDASASKNTTDDPACRIVEFLGSLSALTRLRLGSNALCEAGCLSLGTTLGNLGLLTELDASHVELGQDAQVATVAIAKALRGLTELQVLGFANNAVRASGADKICSALTSSTSLRSIDLGLNQLGSDGAAILARHLTALLSLETLKVPENAFGSEGGRALGSGLARLSRLTFLDLRCNDLGQAGGKAVLDGLVAAARAGACTLSTLDLRNNNVGADGGAGGAERLAWLDGLARLSGLTTLSLAANNLADAGGQRVVAAVAHHTGLSELDLGDNNLGPNCGLAISEGLGRLPALRTLFLEGNSLRLQGAGAVVSQIGVLATVQTLDLRDNKLGTGGGIAVGGALSRLTALRSLDLEGNALGPLGGDAVAQGVAGLGLLEALDLRHNSLGPEGCRSVRGILSSLGALRLDVRWNDAVGSFHGGERTPDLVTATLVAFKVPQMRKRDSHRALYAPTIRGNLQKLGQGRDPDGDEHWRDRLCFVSDGCLFYESAKKKGEKELVTALAQIRSVLPPPVDSRPGRFMFTVEVVEGTGRAMTFAAATAHERKRWITALLRKRPEEPVTPAPKTHEEEEEEDASRTWGWGSRSPG